MRARLDRRGSAVLVGAAGQLALLLAGVLTVAFTDYELEALPAVTRLRAGDLAGFVDALPAYGGSLVLRAPFALLGGSELATLRWLCVPALAAALALGAVLWRPGRAGWLALVLCAVNPLTLRALQVGHPEELLGAAACAGAVLAAVADRPRLAGLLLGVALANKAWALLAVLPVVLALPDRRALGRALALAVPVGAMGLTGVLAQGDAAGSGVQAGAIFQPWQLWWFLGSHGAEVHGVYGLKEGFRTPPAFTATLAHPLVIAVPVALSVVWAARTRGDLAARRADALGLLALAMALRCGLDPWNTAYYELPLLLALTAWEVASLRRAPWLAACATVAAYGTLVVLGDVLSPDAQSLAFVAWMVPLTGWLALRLLAPEAAARLAAPSLAAVQRRLPTLARLA